jgi:hypothetical protein
MHGKADFDKLAQDLIFPQLSSAWEYPSTRSSPTLSYLKLKNIIAVLRRREEPPFFSRLPSDPHLMVFFSTSLKRLVYPLIFLPFPLLLFDFPFSV